ncbi:MAG: trigger factor [candidate division WOR-3 bacterium]|nr:MAG: trigger factor [candidate division WOR-3 bacterium]
METRVTSPEAWLREIEVEIEPERLKDKVGAMLDDYKDRAEVPGFRKGRVPKRILEKRMGSAIESAAAEEIVEQSSREVLEQQDIRPAARPQLTDLQIAPDKTIRFRLRLEVIPEFELKSYEGLALKKEEPTGFDQEFDRRLRQLQERCATFRPVSRPADKGDFVVADVTVAEGEAEPGPPRKNQMIELGAELNLPEINEALTGARPGDQKTAEVAIPADHPDKNLAGQKRGYRFEVREVKEKLLPEVDEELAADLGYENLDELRKDINDQLLSERERLTENGLKNQVFDYLVNEHDFAPPESWVKFNIERLRREYELPDDEDTNDKLSAAATRRAKFDVIAARIAQDQNIEVTEDEIRTQVEELARTTQKPAEDVAPLLDNPAYRSRLLRDKVLKYILSKAEVQ